MNTAPPRVLRVERVDDLPVLFASLKRLQVAEFLDRHFPTHHLWKGELSFGEVVCVWLVFLTCQFRQALGKSGVRQLGRTFRASVRHVGVPSVGSNSRPLECV